MRENDIMKWITYAGIAFLIYLFLRFKNVGTVAQTSACRIPMYTPNATRCCVVPFVSDNPAIALASDYLCCGLIYRPAVSRQITPTVRNQNHIGRAVALVPVTSYPQGVRQTVTPPCIGPNVYISSLGSGSDGNTPGCVCSCSTSFCQCQGFGCKI